MPEQDFSQQTYYAATCETCGRSIKCTPPLPHQRLRVTCRGPGGVAEGKMHDMNYIPAHSEATVEPEPERIVHLKDAEAFRVAEEVLKDAQRGALREAWLQLSAAWALRRAVRRVRVMAKEARRAG